MALGRRRWIPRARPSLRAFTLSQAQSLSTLPAPEPSLAGWRTLGAGARSCLLGFGLLLVVLFVSQADLWLYREGWVPLRPTLLYLALVAPVALALAVREGLRPGGGARVVGLLARASLVWGALLLLGSAALLASALGTGNLLDDLGYVALYFLDAAALGLAMLLGLSRTLRASLRPAALATLCLLVATVAVDTVWPGTFSKIEVRAAGLPQEPNAAAFLILLCLALTLRWDRFRPLDTLCLALATLGLFGTLSRGGAVMFAALLALWVGRLWGPALWARRPWVLSRLGEAGLSRIGGLRWLVGRRGLAAVAVAAALLTVGTLLALFRPNAVPVMFERQKAQERLAFLSDPLEALSDSQDRVVVVESYVGYILERPLFGHGAAFPYRQEKGAHNRFLHEWAAGGLLGLAAFCLLLAASWALFLQSRAWEGVAFTLLLTLFALLSHILLDYRAVLLPWGLLLARTLLEPKAAEAA